jgi:hypothetical protein
MLTRSHKPKVGALVAIGFLLIGAAAQAQVTNGSLSGPIANGGVPPGWTLLAGSPDTMDAGNNVGVPGLQDFGVLPSASPDGGTWVGMGASQGFIETFGQTLTGLSTGVSYTISWYAGNFGYINGYTSSNAIDVLIDNTSVGTGATLNLGSNWFSQSVSFTATSSSQNLSFQLANSNSSYLSIDGISISTTAVPEPETWALVLAGLACVGVGHVRRLSVAAHDQT